MTAEKRIPFYAPDGASLGTRTHDAATRLIEGGHVKPSWGKKGNLRAIWMQSGDGSNPIQPRLQQGTKYSFLQRLENGRCWTLRKLEGRDENGVPFCGRFMFTQVIADCMVEQAATAQPATN